MTVVTHDERYHTLDCIYMQCRGSVTIVKPVNVDTCIIHTLNYSPKCTLLYKLTLIIRTP